MTPQRADERIVAVLESNAIEAAILAQAVGVGAGCVYALRGQFASLSLNSLSRLSSRNESPTLGEWEVHWRNAAGQDIRVDRGTLTVEDRGMGFVPFEVRLTAPDGFCVYALAAVLPLLSAKQRQLPADDWLERDSLVACPDPDERVILRIERIGRRTLDADDLT